MNLQPLKPNRHTSGWKGEVTILCTECYKMKDESKMFADLDRTWHFVCYECAPSYKGTNKDET